MAKYTIRRPYGIYHRTIGGSKHPVAFCYLHGESLSLRQMKGRECQKKGCPHLKLINSSYWETLRRHKEEKREEKRLEKEKIRRLVEDTRLRVPLEYPEEVYYESSAIIYSENDGQLTSSLGELFAERFSGIIE